MTINSQQPTKKWPTKVVFAMFLLFTACESAAEIGQPCQTQSQCVKNAQCLLEICVPSCNSKQDCGDGYLCDDENGQCQIVESIVGDLCKSEWECAIGQSCVLDKSSKNATEFLAATCQPQGTGVNTRSLCKKNEDCRDHLCSLGRCSQICENDGDCPNKTSCAQIPLALENRNTLFRGCLPSQETIEKKMSVTSANQVLSIPVPSSVQSFTIVSSLGRINQYVGIDKLVAPNGDLLFREDLIQPLNSIIHYKRQPHISTLMIPNNDDNSLQIQTGIYKARVKTSKERQGTGTLVPEVSVFYKMHTSQILDLHFYFLDLQDHPCGDKILNGKVLNAKTAQQNASFRNQYFSSLGRILRTTGLTLGTVIYKDINIPTLNSLTDETYKNLFRQANNDKGIAIFFVRSISPAGLLVKIGGNPGPPRTPGTSASGIAISMDNLCFGSWAKQAQITVHAIAAQMGLMNTIDMNGIVYSISDSEGEKDNLMYYSDLGSTTLSSGQKKVLSNYPGLR